MQARWRPLAGHAASSDQPWPRATDNQTTDSGVTMSEHELETLMARLREELSRMSKSELARQIIRIVAARYTASRAGSVTPLRRPAGN